MYNQYHSIDNVITVSLVPIKCHARMFRHNCIFKLYPDLPLKGVSWDLYRTNILP